MGRKTLENEEYRKSIFENSVNVDIKMNSPMLTSMLKGQYGQSKIIRTPKGQKRKNYKGIGAENRTNKNVKLKTKHNSSIKSSSESELAKKLDSSDESQCPYVNDAKITRKSNRKISESNNMINESNK